MKTTAIMLTITLAMCGVLTGCGQTASTADATNVATTTNQTQSLTPTNDTAETTTSNQTSADTTNTSAPQSANTGSTNNAAGSTDTAPQTNAAKLVTETMHLAKQGKVLGIPFAVKSNLTQVNQQWGKGSGRSAAGAGIYTTYAKHNAAFGWNKGEQIFDVRSYSKTLQSITKSDITQVLGKPGAVRETSDSQIYLYPAGPDYQLLFVFSKSKSGDVSAYVDHVSVFWPQGTVDSMAATQPSPSIVIDNAPGTVGSLFTFSIKNPPKGYHLAELEWIPKSGNAVVNTLSQAIEHGQHGGQGAGFNISGDGQNMSFIYTSDMRKQTGRVRVIYQAVSGAAMIGQSDLVTLK